MNDEDTLSKITTLQYSWGDQSGVISQEIYSIDTSTFTVDIDSTWAEELAEDMFWRDVLKEAETNEALQHAIERVKIIYHLSKKEPPPMWHPV